MKLTCCHVMHEPPAWRSTQRWAPEARRQPPPWMTSRRAPTPARLDTPLLSPAGRSASPLQPPSTVRRAAEWRGTSRLGREGGDINSIRETDAVSNTRGMQLQLISTVTTVAVFKPAVVIATVLQSDICCCMCWVSVCHMTGMNSWQQQCTLQHVSVHSPIPLAADFTLHMSTLVTNSMCTDYILPAVMRRAPPNLNSLWLMKGTPQTKRKPPVRAATRPRIISTVQKPRNTARNTPRPPSELIAVYIQWHGMASVCIWAIMFLVFSSENIIIEFGNPGEIDIIYA